jgi:chromate reductase
MYKVAVIVGSLRAESINQKFARALAKLASRKLHFSFVNIGDLPVYNQDFDMSMPLPAREMKAAIEAADAVLLVTPEHNRSTSTALKNAIDWASRPYGKSSWAGKPVAIAGASAGPIGTAVAQQHLRTILGHLDAAVLGQPEVFFSLKPDVIDENLNVADEGTRQFLLGFLDRFHNWISRLSVRELQDKAA